MEPARRWRERIDPHPRRLARARHARVGLGRRDRTPVSACASSTAASSSTIRSSATVQRSVAATKEGDEIKIVEDDLEGDLCGHGTACAGIIRALAPDCELHERASARRRLHGQRPRWMLAGLEWAIHEGFDIVNMSLSTTKKQYVDRLHELADLAYFKRVMLVASAHNMPVESFPWRFASVISVGSHEVHDPQEFFYANPSPPVEFFARGLNLDIAWLGGQTIRAAPATASRRRTSPASAR